MVSCKSSGGAAIVKVNLLLSHHNARGLVAISLFKYLSLDQPAASVLLVSHAFVLLNCLLHILLRNRVQLGNLDAIDKVFSRHNSRATQTSLVLGDLPFAFIVTLFL